MRKIFASKLEIIREISGLPDDCLGIIAGELWANTREKFAALSLSELCGRNLHSVISAKLMAIREHYRRRTITPAGLYATWIISKRPSKFFNCSEAKSARVQLAQFIGAHADIVAVGRGYAVMCGSASSLTPIDEDVCLDHIAKYMSHLELIYEKKCVGGIAPIGQISPSPSGSLEHY